MDDSKLEPSLVAAYRETHDEVADTTPFTLRVGLRSAALAQTHQRDGVISSAFVTACNSYSRALTE